MPRPVVVSSLSCLALMLRAGVGILRALEILRQQTELPAYQHIVAAMGKDIEGGRPLSHAMRSHPRTFNRVQVALTEAAEAGGGLPETLDRMVTAESRELQLLARVKSACVYPVIVLLVASVVMAVVSQFLVRSTRELMTRSGQVLPLSTRCLLELTTARGLLCLLVAVALLATLIASWLGTDAGAAAGRKALLRLPVVGKTVLHLELGRMLRALAVLYGGGVPLMTALTLVSDMTRFRDLRDWFSQVRDRIENGTSLSEALGKIPAVPAVVRHFTETGESSGKLAAMLSRVADWYDQEVEHSIEVLVAALEPALVCGMGIVVGVIVLVAFAPVYQMMAHVAL